MLTSALSVDCGFLVLYAASRDRAGEDSVLCFGERARTLGVPDYTMIISYKGISPKIDGTAFVAAGAQIIGDVHIGSHSSVWFNCVLRADCYYIRIGENTNIQDNTVIHVTQGQFATVIGSYVTVGHSAVLHGCTIKDRCLIGIGAI